LYEKENTVGIELVGYGASFDGLELVDNQTLIERYGWSITAEQIVHLTGIETRYHAGGNVSIKRIACDAAEKALESAKIDIEDIDGVYLATSTPRRDTIPSLASCVYEMLGGELELPVAPFDINASCAGGIVAVRQAWTDMLLEQDVSLALIIGVELASHAVSFDEPNTAMLFGDGAGAVVLQRREGEYGIRRVFTGGGCGVSHLEMQNCALQMNGARVFKNAIPKMADIILHASERCKIDLAEIDYFACHQANGRILLGVAKRLGVPKEKFGMSVRKFGNTSAASVFIDLSEAYDTGRLRGARAIALAAFGAGFVWGATVLRMRPDTS
jgi:3-oxoacyl-[acyl-carrier-protein] synthase III